jgi:hypothetical protein
MSWHTEDYTAAWAKVIAVIQENPKLSIGVACFLGGLLFYAVFL